MTAKSRALASLALLLPAPTVGTLCAVVLFPGTAVGAAAFALSKVWILALPLVWHRYVDGERIGIPVPRSRGVGAGASIGAAIALLLVVAYLTVARALVDPALLRARVLAVGLDTPGMFVAGAVYWTIVNALLEEYVWRWFVVRQFSRLVPAPAAVVASALAFTVHHVVSLAVYMPPAAAAISSAGVCAGGILWGWMFVRYGSVWPAYVSHAIVDAAIFAIGYAIVFG